MLRFTTVIGILNTHKNQTILENSTLINSIIGNNWTELNDDIHIKVDIKDCAKLETVLSKSNIKHWRVR